MQFIIGLDQKIFLFFNQFHHELLNGPMTILSSTTIWLPFILFLIFTQTLEGKPRNLIYLCVLTFGGCKWSFGSFEIP
jgi:hypothetical protein